jgi:hypothetical protein
MDTTARSKSTWTAYSSLVRKASHNKGLQRTPNSEVQSIRGIVLAAGATASTLMGSAVWCS